MDHSSTLATDYSMLSNHEQDDIFMDDLSFSSKNKPWHQTSGGLFVLVVTALVLAAGAYYVGADQLRQPLQLKLQSAEETRNILLEQHTLLLAEKEELSRVLPQANAELEKAVERLKQELDEKELALQQHVERRSNREQEMLQLVGEYHVSAEQREQSEQQNRDAISKFIKTLAYDRYGTATQQVEFTVRIWRNGRYQEGTFVVEMADFDDMPVSSYWFLQQVEHGLWDMTSFYLNAPHLLMAQPISGTREIYRLPEMEAVGLAHLPMIEYAEDVPHEPYTLGFGNSMATAGGFFFINKLDNTQRHKGQPCFARVVKGFDVVNRITEQPTESIDFHIQPVDIVSVKLMTPVSSHSFQSKLEEDVDDEEEGGDSEDDLDDDEEDSSKDSEEDEEKETEND